MVETLQLYDYGCLSSVNAVIIFNLQLGLHVKFFVNSYVTIVMSY